MMESLKSRTAASGKGEVARYSQYDGFAATYNAYFGHFVARSALVWERLLLQGLTPGARILDVCCGTGQLAAAFSERGFQVTGIDGSAEMLHFARKNAPAATFILGDARAFDLPEAFEGAISTFDSINHLLSLDELTSVFANVHRALQPGGTFMFDMNMEDGFLCRWWGDWQGVQDGRTFTIRASYCPAEKLGRNLVSYVVADSEAAELEFVERCYSEGEVRSALHAAGFTAIESYDGHRDLGLLGEIGRSFFACRKPAWPGAPASIPGSRPFAEFDYGDPPRICGDRRSPRSHRFLHRSRETCLVDAVWPTAAIERELGSESRRLKAVEEVLCTLPRAPYDRLRHSAGQFCWFMPSVAVLGQVFPAFPPDGPWRGQTRHMPDSRFVYLSPVLEQHDWPVVVTVAVHELCHVILNHVLIDLDRDAYDLQEAAVQQAIHEWGFQLEADAANLRLANHLLQRGDSVLGDAARLNGSW